MKRSVSQLSEFEVKKFNEKNTHISEIFNKNYSYIFNAFKQNNPIEIKESHSKTKLDKHSFKTPEKYIFNKSKQINKYSLISCNIYLLYS